ncbi:ATP-binding cassette, subfamily B, MsbA [Mongoliibacter ruber]|uniref:ATP-binding cassette, subfamily B, MsbA n=2 Tax=Mongoliibacter ruber TaxID=1750599 RepID=A0A2T0WG56_9BACT|nr:ATP-binding cassette, subfamily B, MsbA [Mongoliibacter ruber]
MDGFGLAMFLPLLQMVDGGDINIEVLGRLGFILEGLVFLRIPINLVSVLILIFVFFSLKGIIKFFEGLYKTVLNQLFMRKVRDEHVDLLSNYKYKAFSVADSGKIQNTITGEVNKLNAAYSAYFLAMQALVMVTVYMALAFSVNAKFSILVIVGGLLTNFIYTYIFKRTKALSKKLTVINHQFQGLLIQKVAFFKYLKATGSIGKFKDKLKSGIRNIEENQKWIGVNNAVVNAIREPIIIGIVVAVILLEILMFKGSLALIILSLMFFYRALTYVLNFQNYWNMFLSNYGTLENMVEFSKELGKDQETLGGLQLKRFAEQIAFDDVWFFYDAVPVLKEINLRISKNQTIALVGESGAGKTTLINLISGLYLPDKGTLSIDGIPFQDIDMRTYQNKIGYITQEPVIFDDSIFNNVTFWAEQNEQNIKRFWEAVEKASIKDFILSLEQKENSRLGNNGILVSGGQKQRLSIARELFKEVEILLMDEATSALDSETEASIQTNIEKLKGQFTIIIIAHRLSTVKNADQLILMEKGRIKQMGTFEVLMQESQGFKKMVEFQLF